MSICDGGYHHDHGSPAHSNNCGSNKIPPVHITAAIDALAGEAEPSPPITNVRLPARAEDASALVAVVIWPVVKFRTTKRAPLVLPFTAMKYGTLATSVMLELYTRLPCAMRSRTPLTSTKSHPAPNVLSVEKIC